MKNYYYVHYYRDFANTYNLWYAPADMEVPETFERITRAKALRLASKESDRRKNDPAFSGYASKEILPYAYAKDREDVDWDDARLFWLDGRIVRVKS